ncbi:hypothetical protein GCM10010260_58480 [Streptomyces filipinensis]|uniref:Uncharacterized protein n=1 Tax=Streptomyces filipinensis TaxID=66887 RepID=A0A918IFT9_9ACTN|nr:hypothetical protein GCM10010260_58480 [Streptomyces filipinensis]
MSESEIVSGSEGVGVVLTKHPNSVLQGALEVRDGALGLALVDEKDSGAVQQGGGGCGVGGGGWVADEGVDVGN